MTYQEKAQELVNAHYNYEVEQAWGSAVATKYAVKNALITARECRKAALKVAREAALNGTYFYSFLDWDNVIAELEKMKG